MKLLLFLFLIARSELYFFPHSEVIQNETYVNEARLQQSHKQQPMVTKKLLVVLLACLCIVVVATLLTVYLTKDRMKGFAAHMGIGSHESVVHHFHPEILVQSSTREQSTTSYKLPANKKIGSSNLKDAKQERTSAHTFLNSSAIHPGESVSSYRRSQSATNLFLYR